MITLKLDKHYSGVRVDTDRFRMGAKPGVKSTTLDSKRRTMFGGPPPMHGRASGGACARVVAGCEAVAENCIWETSSLCVPGWAGIVYAEQYRVAVLARPRSARLRATSPAQRAECRQHLYRPPSVELLTQQAAEGRRFPVVVKAYTGLTTAPYSTGAARGIDPVFWTQFAEQMVVVPWSVAGIAGAVCFSSRRWDIGIPATLRRLSPVWVSFYRRAAGTGVRG